MWPRSGAVRILRGFPKSVLDEELVVVKTLAGFVALAEDTLRIEPKTVERGSDDFEMEGDRLAHQFAKVWLGFPAGPTVNRIGAQFDA